LAQKDRDDSVAFEVESRLDDIFGDEDDSVQAEEELSIAEPDDHPLRELKSIVLSIEWEITDEVMTDFVEQIDRLKEKYQNDRITLLLLQLLSSIGKYIRRNKSKSHPKAFKILNSVFRRLEQSLIDPEMSESDKKRALFIELNKFKALKEEIAPSKRPPARRPTTVDTDQPEEKNEMMAPEVAEAPAAAEPSVAVEKPAGIMPTDPVILKLDEIKQFIKAEFERLRKDLLATK
jgi:hypothetical protein